MVAVVSGVVGVFTVMRGQSFAGHALADVVDRRRLGRLPGRGEPAVGLRRRRAWSAPAAMELIGVQRVRGRDLATGIVLGAALGLAALFLYLDTTTQATTGATSRSCSGRSSPSTARPFPVVVGLQRRSRSAIVAVLYRPLLLSSVSPDLAAARGVPVRLVGSLFMVALAVAVGLSALAIGAILSTALLIGPAATALRLTSRLGCGHGAGRGRSASPPPGSASCSPTTATTGLRASTAGRSASSSWP